MPSPVVNLILRSPQSINPASLPGIAAWYSADYGVLTSVGPDVAATNGQTVRRWLDKSGNGRDLDQATLLNQPTFATTYLQSPCLRSLGTGSFQLTGLPSSTEATHYTVFSCASSNYVTDGQLFLTNGFWIASDRSVQVNSTNSGRLVSPSTYIDTDITKTAIVAIRYSVTIGKQMSIGTGAGNIGVIQEFTTPVIVTVAASTGITLFRHGSGTVASNTNIVEHIRYWGQTHDDATMRKMIKYLARKWGIQA